jgi:hypothetical protein
MSLLVIDVREESARTQTGMDIQISFSEPDATAYSIIPSRISGQAGDLADCDAASTCPSDTDETELLNSECWLESIVDGSSVMIKHLDPTILTADMEASVTFMGFHPVRVLCPTFLVYLPGANTPGTREFNFGYARVSFATVEEAASFNFMINSRGSFDINPEDTSSLCDNDYEVLYDPFKLHLMFEKNLPVKDQTYYESQLQMYLSYYGHVVSLTSISGMGYEVTFSSEESAQFILASAADDPHITLKDTRFFVHQVEATVACATVVL